jgi:small subunit ribosomal protein S1
MDKGAVVALPYGVEGFVTPKHLVKEDGSPVKLDEKLDFKVIEFNKSAKKIILSHSRIHEDEQKSSVRATSQSEGAEVRKATRKLKTNLEKTTLGDISELAALKTEMEENQKIADKKKGGDKDE